MERKLDLRPCVVWVGGDAFVQIVDVALKGGVSDLSLNIQVLNKSGFVLVKADYEIYFYDSVETKLQDEAYIVSGDNLDIRPNDIGFGLQLNISGSFPSARRAIVKLLKATFSDGKTIDLVYEDMEKFALTYIKDEDLSLLKTVAGDDAICLPAMLSLNWRCVCGYFNGEESELCSNCMRDQSQVFADYGSIDKIKETIERELKGDIDETTDDLLAELEMSLYPLEEFIEENEDTTKEEEKIQEEEEVLVKIDEEEEEEEKEQLQVENITLTEDIRNFFSNVSKISITMLLFAAVLISTSIFTFIFRLR